MALLQVWKIGIGPFLGPTHRITESAVLEGTHKDR